MRFLLGWMFKLGFLGVAYLAMTGDLKLKVPDTVLGYEMPQAARQCGDRGGPLGDMAKQTRTALKQISDSFK